MHFSIPDTQELYAEAGSGSGGLNAPSYTAYNIYINGNYHCCLRYKQLHALHEQLRRRCAHASLPPFPPKRLLPLTNNQLETRRSALEHYLQIIGQDARIARLPYLQQFLQRAQLQTALAEGTILSQSAEQQVEVEVFTGSAAGSQLLVNCQAQQNASALLQSVGQALHLPSELLPYFCLYLMRKQPELAEEEDELPPILLLRRLMDFEAPFITRLHAQPCQLLLRTCYWNASWDAKLVTHSVALELLYHQTLADVAREWLICTPELNRQLRSLQLHCRPRQYLELARQLPSYGCLQFGSAMVDYPEVETSALVSIGHKELSLRTARGAKIYETKFRVTRMRCWRVSALHNTLESRDEPSQLQLAFEYLMSKQTLRWITITSPQAMLMSVCLQAMVDELLQHAEDEETHQMAPSTSSESNSSTPSSASSTSTSYMSNFPTAETSTSAATPPVKFLAQRLTPTSRQQHKLTTARTFAAVFFRNDDSNAAAAKAVRNEAFEGIGDDDL